MNSTALRIVAIMLIFFSFFGGTKGQYPAGYVTSAGRNPAFAGATGDGTLRMVYMSHYPGGGYNLNSMHLSYDSYIEPMRGGLGVAVDSDHPGGLMNDIRGRAAYSYHLRVGRELYLFGGLNAGLIYRAFNRGNLLFPDQIDPVTGVINGPGAAVPVPASLFFDMGAGFLAEYRNIVLAAAVDHLITPDLSRSGIPDARLDRVLIVQSHYTRYNRNESVAITPYAGVTVSAKTYRAAIGGAVKYDNVAAGALYIHSRDLSGLQLSVSLSSNRITWLYAFRFSTSGTNPGIPFALLHQAGIRASLNIVDKRYSVRTIFFPDL